MLIRHRVMLLEGIFILLILEKYKAHFIATLSRNCFHRRQIATNEPNRGIKDDDRKRSIMATTKKAAKPVAKSAAKPVKK